LLITKSGFFLNILFRHPIFQMTYKKVIKNFHDTKVFILINISN